MPTTTSPTTKSFDFGNKDATKTSSSKGLEFGRIKKSPNQQDQDKNIEKNTTAAAKNNLFGSKKEEEKSKKNTEISFKMPPSTKPPLGFSTTTTTEKNKEKAKKKINFGNLNKDKKKEDGKNDKIGNKYNFDGLGDKNKDEQQKPSTPFGGISGNVFKLKKDDDKGETSSKKTKLSGSGSAFNFGSTNFSQKTDAKEEEKDDIKKNPSMTTGKMTSILSDVTKTETAPEKKKDKKPPTSFYMQLIIQKNEKIKECYKKRMTEFYTKHNAEKLSNVDKMLSKYPVDKLHDVYAKLCKKYNQTPLKKFTGDTPDVMEDENETNNNAPKPNATPKTQNVDLKNMFGGAIANKSETKKFQFETKTKKTEFKLGETKSEDVQKTTFMKNVAKQKVDFSNTTSSNTTPTLSINTGGNKSSGGSSNPFAGNSNSNPFTFNLPSSNQNRPTSTPTFSLPTSTGQQTPSFQVPTSTGQQMPSFNFNNNNSNGNNNNGGGNNAFNNNNSNNNGGGNNNPFGAPTPANLNNSPFSNMAANTNSFSSGGRGGFASKASPGGGIGGFTMGRRKGKKR